MSDQDPDSVDFLCKDDNILLPLVSLTFSCVATITIGFYIFQKLTKLRISLFLTSVATTLAAGTNILWEIYDCEHKFFHYLFNLVVFELFIFVVVWCFLDIGKKFYPPNQRNTLFFKVIIGACVIFGMGGVSQIVFTIHDNDNPNETAAKEIIYMADLVLGWILLTLAFFYTFKPIIKFRIFSKRQMSTINPRNSAVGIWYLLVTSLISVSYLSFMIYMFTKGFETPKIFRGPNSKAIDYIHRTILILNQSLPPPNYILNLIGKIQAYAIPQNTNNRNINILDGSVNDTATSETVININNNNNFNNKNNDDSKDINNNDTKISLDTSDGSLDSSNSTL